MSYLGKETQITQAGQAVGINIEAIQQLSAVIKNGLGPNGATKLLITPAGEVRLVKDGHVLLKNIQLAQPGAVLLSRMVTQQGSEYGDGVTASIVLSAAMLVKALEYIREGIHPQTIISGIVKKEKEIKEELEKMKIPFSTDKEMLFKIVHTSLRTKFSEKQAAEIAHILLSAVETVTEEKKVNLKMLEIMKMTKIDASKPLRIVEGLVLDHGGRHPMMPKKMQNVFILCTNLSFEYEKPEINAQFYYKSTQEKREMEIEERKMIMERVRKVLEIMHQLANENRAQSPQFMLITQKGIDQHALDAFARYNVLALRRAKKRNMERLQRLTGCKPVDSVSDLTKDAFGYAGSVREIAVGEEKYTFIEKTPFKQSCTLLIQGISPYQMEYMDSAIRSALQSISKGIEDQAAIPGGASVFSRLASSISVSGSTEEQVAASIWKQGLLSVPKTLSKNLGYNSVESLAKISSSNLEYPMIDSITGDAVEALDHSVVDNYSVAKNTIQSSLLGVTKILLIDDIIKGGKEVK